MKLFYFLSIFINAVKYNPRFTQDIDSNMPENTTPWPAVCSMLVHRLRRWPNIKQTVGYNMYNIHFAL